jgi:hypothetical protein
LSRILDDSRAWFRRLTFRARTAVVVLAVLALAGISFGVYLPVNDLLNAPCMRNGATEVTHQGQNKECIGITDGSYHFDPALADVESQILKENQQIRQEHAKNYVSVVLLLPISANQGSIMSMANAVEQVRGAFTAQHYANRNSVEGIAPYIQLLVGSDGYQANESGAAATIIQNASGRQHIAAVSGMGLSLAGTQDAVLRLTSHQIPVFGATLTSTTYDNIKDFIRVSPSNSDNAAVALRYVEPTFQRAVLVEDGNALDSYDATLVSGFAKFNDPKTHHQIVGKETYDTTDRDRPDQSKQSQKEAEDQVNTRISQMAVNICADQPAVVLFAGRGQDLGALLHTFSTTCLDKSITIISGDDVTNLPNTRQLRSDLAGKVTVEYAGVAHPHEWDTAHQPPTQAESLGLQGFRTFDIAFQQLFHGAPLTDGNTMMAYDATLTGISAIRLTEQKQPGADAVASELGALHGAHKVLGASGPLEFTADYRTSDNGSNPVGKAIPIVRLGTDGNPQVLTVEWPSAAPRVR